MDSPDIAILRHLGVLFQRLDGAPLSYSKGRANKYGLGTLPVVSLHQKLQHDCQYRPQVSVWPYGHPRRQ